MSFIPYAQHTVSQSDIDAVVAALKSERLTQGPLAETFAAEVAQYCNARHAVAVTNASMGLIAACHAAGVAREDWVWTTPNTFAASANCARHCGARVDFVDIDPRTFNMSVSALEQKLVRAAEQQRLPKAVIPVHFAGQSCDMQAIARLAREYDFVVIEDAAHALGGAYLDKKVGACEYSDMTVFSFHPVKSITAAEGGMVLCNSAELYQRLQDVSRQGVVRDSTRFLNDSDAPWYYEQHSLGYNMRMTELQAALGRSQLHRLDEVITERRRLAARYAELLKSLPVQLPELDAAAKSAWHLYVIRIDFMTMDKDKAAFVQSLAKDGIGTQVHYMPVHLHPYYQLQGFTMGDFPVSEVYYQQALSLPLYPGLTDEQQDCVVAALARQLVG